MDGLKRSKDLLPDTSRLHAAVTQGFPRTVEVVRVSKSRQMPLGPHTNANNLTGVAGAFDLRAYEDGIRMRRLNCFDH